MKKLLFLCLLSLFATVKLLAQQPPQFEWVKLEKKNDFKAADSTVMQTSNYLLSTPINQDSTTRLKAAQFLMKWMDGTADYTFVLDENSTKYFINDINLMAVYIAALSKAALLNKPRVNSKTITINAVKILLAYSNNKNNNVTWTDSLKELSDKNQKGELEGFMNL